MNNAFVWADLSTSDLEEAKRFYSKSIGWKFQDIGESYLACDAGGELAAGIYTMPEKFQRIGMPSFWMSYIQVSDIHHTVRLAEQHGARVEIKPEAWPGGGLIALIRDPAGAGFTCYEGEDPRGKRVSSTAARIAWNELHVSDLALVHTFYSNVFNWKITPSKEDDRYDIHNTSGELVAGIRVLDNKIKGDKEYWGVFISVANIQTVTEKIKQAGGQIVSEHKIGDINAVLAYDSQGAAFFLLEEKRILTSDKDTTQPTMKWRAILGLIIVLLAVIYNANWIWGILFLIWIIPDIKSGSTHFLEHVERCKNPIVYWLIVGTWLLLSIYIVAGAVSTG